jgi:transposase-like protein
VNRAFSELQRRFSTDDACLEFLKERSYPNGTACPSCNKRSRFHRITGRSAYSCQYCGHHVYPTAGTIFHRSRTRLMLWFRAIELVRAGGDGVTARDLERELGVSYKTALRMTRQVRLLLDEDPDPLASGRQPHRQKGISMRKRFATPSRPTRRFVLRALPVVAIAVGVALGVSQARVTQHQETFKGSHYSRLDPDRFQTAVGKIGKSGERNRLDGPNQETYSNQAYPALAIAPAQVQTAARAAARIRARAPHAPATGWQLVGPSGVSASKLVAGESTGATSGTTFSGRVTALAVSPTCTADACPMLAGAAGGGVWVTANAMANNPKWVSSNGTIPSNAIGSIVFDPNDPTGMTVYVGTGEPNGSSDSEAGVGLYKSTDGGTTWSPVAGSTAADAPCADNPSSLTCPVATGRSIGAIAVDPADEDHIFIGTDVARHGSSSVNGGRFAPPGVAQVGLYESTDGGTTFDPVVILAQDTVDPASANGGDFFRGGASDVEIDQSNGDVYASFFDYGIYRRSAGLDGDTDFHQIFASAGDGDVANSSFSRTEFSLAPSGGNLRVYVGDTGDGDTADFYTVADAHVSAATLFTGGTNGGWNQRSSSTNGTPGFGSFNYCLPQCSYDMPVFSPPGFPNVVYIGGAMQYDELGGRSNGRAVTRSGDAGVNFTDMTIDKKGVSLHPDQHAIAGVPFSSDIVFIGNDGGIFRTDGTFFDASGSCAGRGLGGADLTDCTNWLSEAPTKITAMNKGLSTLQFQSLSANMSKPKDIMGGTQDNGTQVTTNAKKWSVSVFGDGGQSGINAKNSKIRVHTYYLASPDINFNGTNEKKWDWIGDPLFAVEPQSFYIPIIFDPVTGGQMFAGLDFLWRTQDNGGPKAYLDTVCNELTGTFSGPCGDWVPVGPSGADDELGDGTNWGADKADDGYITEVTRASSDATTIWVGTRRGRVFVSKNANAAAGSVAFDRIDVPDGDAGQTPHRFVSGIAVDPANPNHAFISFSGYDAYATAAGTATGHVFDVTYNPGTHDATWTDISHDLGDQPITDVAFDPNTGDLYASTDWGVDVLSPASSDTTWQPASTGLPTVAVYGLTINPAKRVLYAATHGRSAWTLNLP